MSFRIDQLAVLNLATVGNSITAGSFVKSGGTSSQFLKADGSVDTNTYITGITSGMITTALGYTPVPTTRTLTINGTSYDLSADRSWTITAGVSSVTGSGSGISVSPTTGAVIISNTGVTSNVAGTGISVSGATGAVTITNTGVTSVAAGTGISVSASTGGVTITNAGVTSVNGNTGAITGIITTSNYNSYSPTLTGGGASGTWGINISGNSATTSQTNFTSLTVNSNTVLHAGNYTSYAAPAANFKVLGQNVNYNVDRTIKTSGGGLAIYSGYSSGANRPTTYDVSAQFAATSDIAFEIAADWLSSSGPTLYARSLRDCCNNWSSWVTLLTSLNYNSYSPTLTGGGASGTWGINITGTASSETLSTVTGRGNSTGSNIITSANMYASVFYDYNDNGYYLNPASSSRLYSLNIQNVIGFPESSGASTSRGSNPYAIYQEAGGWSWPYPDLCIAFHTGISFGANPSYQGIRFFNDYDLSTQVMSINNGSDPLGANNVYVNNSLQAGSSLRAPIFYDSDDTTYYLNPNSDSYLRSLYLGAHDSGSANFFFGEDSSGWYGMRWYWDSGYDFYWYGRNAGSDTLIMNYTTNSNSYVKWHRYFHMNGYNIDYVGSIYFNSGPATGYLLGNTGGSYGSLQINGTKNGWYGLNFESGNTLMMNNNESGHHQQGYGWKWRWYAGYLYTSRSTYGGGTEYTILDSGNYSSWAVPIGGATLDNIYYFRTNLGGYSGSLSSARLQAYNTDGGSAFMSFHRSGAYAVNFGLDADNVLRIGGWSAAANRWQLDMSGNCWVAGSMRAPIFYDSDDTTYYADFANSGRSVYTAGYYQSSGMIMKGSAGGGQIYPTISNGGVSLYGDNNLTNGAYFTVTGGSYGSSPGAGSAEFVIRSNATSKFAMFSYDGLSYTGRYGLFGATGNVTIGSATTDYGYRLSVVGDAYVTNAMYVGTTSGGYMLTVGGNASGGSIYAYGDIYATGNVTAYSDARVKTNVREIENPLNRVLKSRGVVYDRTDRDSNNNIGFIAQELEEHFPELVSTSSDGRKGVMYQNMVAVLLEAVKEQQKQIDELKAKLN